MSDERRDTLAEQAAAWVPPWSRNRAVDGMRAAPATESPVEERTEPPVDEPAADRETRRSTEALPGTDPAPAEAAAPPEFAEPTGSGELAEPVETLATAEPELTDPSGQARVPQQTDRSTGALALLDDGELRGALEAILLVVDEPVAEAVLAQTVEQPVGRVAALLERLARDYTTAGHGFELRRAAGGWRLYTRPEYAAYVERFVLGGQSVRLTQAALETLAVVAYKQPVTRARISAIRGVNCDGVVRTLTSRGLIEECGTEPETGAYLYRTTTLFLEKLGLDRIDELPPLAPFLPDDVDEVADAAR